jgi:hypothetical protein
MSWTGETDQAQFVSGTVLCLHHQPWGHGVGLPALSPGVAIALHFPNGAVTQIDVVHISESTVVVRTSDGSQWQMEAISPKSLSVPPTPPAGAPATYWKVK